MQHDLLRLILRQSVRGSVRAVRAVRNTWVYLTETWFVGDILSLHFLIPPRFNCIDSHEQNCSLSLRLPCWPTQSANIWCGTHITSQFSGHSGSSMPLPYTRSECMSVAQFSMLSIGLPKLLFRFAQSSVSELLSGALSSSLLSA
jgi:hypothetical protein